MKPTKKGCTLLHDGALNKSTAFTREEREILDLRGLLPYAVSNQETQIQREMRNVIRKAYDIEHIDEITFLIYTAY